jgi:hypothetical protein
MKLEYKVGRGKNQGTTLTPTKQQNGNYVVSKSRYQSDQVYVATIREVHEYLKKGYGVRMGNAKHKIAPSLIKLESIEVIV